MPKIYTKAQWDGLTPEQQESEKANGARIQYELHEYQAAKARGEINEAQLADVEVRGTAVVLDRDGNPKYDDPAMAGQFHEERIRRLEPTSEDKDRYANP